MAILETYNTSAPNDGIVSFGTLLSTNIQKGTMILLRSQTHRHCSI